VSTNSTDVMSSQKGHGRHTVIVMQKVGRLGNQVMLLANMIALSLATGINISHPTLGVYADYFKGTASDLLCRYPQQGHVRNRPSKVKRILLYYICRIIERIGFLNFVARKRVVEGDYKSIVDMAQPQFLALLFGGRYTFLNRGWLYRYSDIKKTKFLHELRTYLALAMPYSANVERIVAQARSGCQTLIGVHIRQTDFKEHDGGKYYFSTEDYAHLMRHCTTLFHPARVAFLVVSDEPHSSANFPDLECFFGSGVDVEDMYCLGYCDYIIGSVASSFSTWPAVLFQKPTYRMASSKAKPLLEEFVLTTDMWNDTPLSKDDK
jgi:hypothetical protein